MKIVYNRIFPIGKKYAAINLFGVFFVKKDVVVTERLINHESIHTRQMKELLYIPFYILYAVEWILLLFKYKFNGHIAYANISHEREAYTNDSNLQYLKSRKRFAQYRKLGKNQHHKHNVCA